MTQDEIIEMARQAHRKLVTEVYFGHMAPLDPWTVELLQIFAKLLAAKEREACIVDIQMHIPRSGRDTLEYKMAMRMIERIKARGKA